MVRDTITYGGQTLLTVYHLGFDQAVGTRRIRIAEKLGAYRLAFEECLVPTEETDRIGGWARQETGLLQPGTAENPYGDAACAMMRHYLYASKPARLFRLAKGCYTLRLPAGQLMQINAFVKKYTGLDMDNAPMLYGDTFVFESCVCRTKALGTEGIVVTTPPDNAAILVHFRQGGAIVCTKNVHVGAGIPEIEIRSGHPWDSHDIEVFSGGKLVYCQRGVHYVRQVQFDMTITGTPREVKLNKIADSFSFPRSDGERVLHIGETPGQLETLFDVSSAAIQKLMRAQKPDDAVTFIEPGGIRKAIERVGSVMQAATEEIWVFDSYFTDIKGVGEMLDWLRILANCKARYKNVVFYCKDAAHALDGTALRAKIAQDPGLAAILRLRKSLGIQFYQTKSPIHDRFVLAKSGAAYSGVGMGTSFNALDEHHYCIYKLNHASAQRIWQGLTDWMQQNGNVLKAEVL